MFSGQPINLLDLVVSVSNATDLISPAVADHHKRVAYIAQAIAEQLGLPMGQRRTLLFASLLHDVGALTQQDREKILVWEQDNQHLHAESAYLLLGKFRHFRDVAEVVRYHHVHWDNGQGKRFNDRPVPALAHLLHLADRVDALLERGNPALGQANAIVAAVSRDSGVRFMPEMVEAFAELAWREYFWLDVVSPDLQELLRKQVRGAEEELDWDDLQDFAELLAQLIDFRSPFTATHSSGVSAVSAMLAALTGFSETECDKMKVAGYLHDIGKLAIPTEVLEKPARLSDDEFRIVKAHAYYTYRILEPIKGLEEVTTWAALHHERLDGNGYPGRRLAPRIPLGSRIVAVADVFTALSERRPYREAADNREIRTVLQDMVRNRALDAAITDILLHHIGDFDRHRHCAQIAAAEDYRKFREHLAAPAAQVALH